MASTDLMLIQNKQNPKIEEYITVEQWERDFVKNKLDKKFNILKRNVREVSTATNIKILTFITNKEKEATKPEEKASIDEIQTVEQGKEPDEATDIIKEKKPRKKNN